MARRTYVLDTNVLLFDPTSLSVFEENDVVLPMVVIEEIDKFKKNLDQTGASARQISRFLDDLRGTSSLKEGVILPGGGKLRIEFSETHTNIFGVPSVDNSILHLVMTLAKKALEDEEVILVTRDTNMRIKCDALGVKAENYQHDRILRDVDDQFSGQTLIDTVPSVVNALHQDKTLTLDDLEDEYELHTNENLVVRSGKQSALARVGPTGQVLSLIPQRTEPVWNILPRNKEQAFAMEMLLDKDLHLVTLAGQAGTGKTLLAIACGLFQTTDERLYRKLLVARPIIPLGRDMGYLPGDIEQKMDPWMKPIYDNLELMVSSKDRKGQPSYTYLFESGLMAVEPLTYIRGRSIPEQFLIIDEAQNLTRHEVKTILTRAGEGTKVVLTGDPAQIDNPYVDAQSNGLTYAIESFKNSPLAGHITLRKGERSPLADAAALLL